MRCPEEGAPQRCADGGDRGPGRSGAFWLYGCIELFTLAFCWKFVPETKGKRLEDIQAFFQERVDHRGARA